MNTHTIVYTLTYIIIGIISTSLAYAIYYFKFRAHEKYLENRNDYLTKELCKVQESYNDNRIKYLQLLANKQEALVEGLDGVKSVNISALKYVELLSKEKELNDIKMKLKDM